MKNTNNNTTKTARFPIQKVTSQPIPEYDVNVRQYEVDITTKYLGEEINVYVAKDKHALLNTPVTMPDFMFFCRNADTFIKLFGEDIVARNLKYISMRDLVREDEYIESTALFLCNANSQNHSMLIEPRKNIIVTEYRGTWERSVQKLGYTVITPNPYASVSEAPLIRKCLLEKYPYMRDFEFDCYAFSQNDAQKEEFYLRVKMDNEIKTIYVPYRALEEKSRVPIIERMFLYFKEYYKNNPQKYRDTMSALESEEALRFFDVIESSETYICKNHEEPIEYEIQEKFKQYKYLLMKASKTDVYEPQMFDTFAEAYEALEIIIENAKAEGAFSMPINKIVKNGSATANITLKNGSAINYRISRIDVTKNF